MCLQQEEAVMALIIEEHLFSDLEMLLVATEALLRAEFANELEYPHAVMLSGGSTPLPIYQAIAALPSAASDSLYITYSDDRHVPYDSPMSNYGHTLPMLAALGVDTDRQLAVNPELPLDEAAEDFEAQLGGFLTRGGRISLALLGIGDDTHTCSLFSQANLDAAAGHLAIPVERDTPPHRVSVTPTLLKHAERIVFLAAGPGKRPVITQLLNDPMTTIAGRAVQDCGQVELWYA